MPPKSANSSLSQPTRGSSTFGSSQDVRAESVKPASRRTSIKETSPKGAHAEQPPPETEDQERIVCGCCIVPPPREDSRGKNTATVAPADQPATKKNPGKASSGAAAEGKNPGGAAEGEVTDEPEEQADGCCDKLKDCCFAQIESKKKKSVIEGEEEIKKLELKDKIYWNVPPNSYGFFISTYLSPIVKQAFRLYHAITLVVLTIICQAGLTVYLATFLDKDNSTCAPFLMEFFAVAVFTATMYGNATFVWTLQLCLFSEFMLRRGKDDEPDKFFKVEKRGKRKKLGLILFTSGIEFLTWIWLLLCGCLYLHGSQDGETLLLNTVALEFVMNIDDVFYNIFVTTGGKERCERCEFAVRIGHKDTSINTKVAGPRLDNLINRPPSAKKGKNDKLDASRMSLDDYDDLTDAELKKIRKAEEMHKKLTFMQKVYDYFPLLAPAFVFGFALLFVIIMRGADFTECGFDDDMA
eukprot:TRINITY_DN14609_c0_g1_i3.p1 TRINITY_DN14609_c0_g1~~TRINITY_DN14609_c0_g1_i3.p1  ORF type:complete len:468 (+),score=143.26 TRINITY_DN14609_c0_g1_i3:63-1466(+)